MEDIEASKLYRLALKYAKSRGLKEESELDPRDFAQDCIVYALKHNNSVGLLLHRYADFCRKRGRTRKDGSAYTNADKNRYEEFHGKRSNIDLITDHIFENIEKDIINIIDLEKKLEKVKPFPRLLFRLNLHYGFKMKELTEIMGVSASYVAVLFAKVRKDLED